MKKQEGFIAVLAIFLLVGCSQNTYQGRSVSLDRLQDHGALTTVNITSSDSTIIGELIFIDDSIYLLTGDNHLIIYSLDEIVTLQIQLSRFRERSYLMLMAIAVPSLLSLLSKSTEVNTFGAVGLVVAGPGLMFSLFENAKQPHFISYPDESLETFKEYARFQEVLPGEIKVRSALRVSNTIAMEDIKF